MDGDVWKAETKDIFIPSAAIILRLQECLSRLSFLIHSFIKFLTHARDIAFSPASCQESTPADKKHLEGTQPLLMQAMKYWHLHGRKWKNYMITWRAKR